MYCVCIFACGIINLHVHTQNACKRRCLAMISVIPREGAWCNMCRDRMLELMQEAGLDYPSVKQAMEIVRERNTP
jgi:hypothetical protein